MSGIYIPGMEMPENCYGCPIAQGYNRPAYCGLNGSIPKLWKEFDDALEKEIKPDFCPLISVPDHGRLIDADVLVSHCKEMEQIEWNNKTAPYSWAYAYESLEDDIDNAKTIIPAEEGE